MSPLQAVTFDFWSTLVDGRVTPQRTAERLARLHRALVGAGLAHTPDELRAAFTRALDRVSEEARESLRDVGPPGRWAVLAAELGIPDGLIPYSVVEQAYEDITLDPLPAPMPHVEAALRAARDAGHRLGVICNTGMAGGRVLRQVLARHGLLQYFDVTVWSNEFGWSKPDPRIFAHTLEALGHVRPERALHVGDLEELDVEGARRAGVHAALYAPGAPDGHVTTDAELVVRDWREFGAQLADFERALARQQGASTGARVPR
jgi:putative hydrolase of the HAD superfamily